MATRSIPEDEAKELLFKYGVPTTRPRLVKTVVEGQRILDEVAGPIALKIASLDIPHKSRIGGVRLGVTRESFSEAFNEVLAAGQRVNDAKISGVLIERMVPPGVELIIGGLWDPVFGPVVMFGAGGTSVEARRDVRFALAPLNSATASRLVEDHTVTRTLTEQAVEELVDVLVKVAGPDGLLMREAIKEIDVNPLIASQEGVIAVDAHAVLTDQCENLAQFSPPDGKSRTELLRSLRAAFDPKSVVVVGASTKPDKLGFSVIRNLIEYGFRGELYAVHPTANNIYGCPAYPSIEAVPSKIVDRAIIIVAAEEVPAALRSCGRKGIEVAQVYSAGFSEWSDSGSSLEQSIRDAAMETGVRVIGPNTIGTFSASGGLTLTAPRYSPRDQGSVAFISQSGTYALDVITRSRVMGIPLAISLSCGNCVDLGPVDYLAYLAQRPDIRVIAMYLESMKDAGRFFRLLEEVEKPVVLLKGGRTRAGFQAATSHTGALASDIQLWRDSALGAGAILVDEIDQLLDVLVGLCAFDGRIEGNGLGLFTSGGGISVGAADVADLAGIHMTELSDETISNLRKYGVPGTSIRNPVDIPVWGLKTSKGYIFNDMVDTLASDRGVDSVIACVEMGSVFSFTADETSGIEQLELVTDSLVKKKTTKPLSAVYRTTGDGIQDDYIRDVRPKLLKRGIAVYPTVERAIRAHARISRRTT